MTNIDDVINQKINNTRAMEALAKGDEMSDLSKEAAKLSEFLTDHIEKFACAFAKETGLDPTKVKMVQQEQRTGDGFGYKVWFEPFPSDSEIEMYRAGQERALAELAARDALIERLIEVGIDAIRAMGGWNGWFGIKRDWERAVAEWQAMKGGGK